MGKLIFTIGLSVALRKIHMNMTWKHVDETFLVKLWDTESRERVYRYIYEVYKKN